MENNHEVPGISTLSDQTHGRTDWCTHRVLYYMDPRNEDNRYSSLNWLLQLSSRMLLSEFTRLRWKCDDPLSYLALTVADSTHKIPSTLNQIFTFSVALSTLIDQTWQKFEKSQRIALSAKTKNNVQFIHERKSEVLHGGGFCTKKRLNKSTWWSSLDLDCCLTSIPCERQKSFSFKFQNVERSRSCDWYSAFYLESIQQPLLPIRHTRPARLRGEITD